jgi:glycosyltransferase involved in cell wall biosynthesis
MTRRVAITPARDEQQLLPGLIASMVAQSRRPARWIIIDDGSGDRTPELLDQAARDHDLTRALRRTFLSPPFIGSVLMIAGCVDAHLSGFRVSTLLTW